jgi:phosphotransferase family enzyme
MVAGLFAEFCRRELGSRPVATLFYESSVGCVAGLELADGHRVVVKAQSLTSPPDFLEAVARTQTALVARGFPAPALLLGPRQIGRTLATVEELVDEGDYRDAHEPSIRSALAVALARLVTLAADLPRDGLARDSERLETDAIWPRPHHRMFDFDATRAGTEWIDELARRAQELLASAGEPVICHTDWTVKHCRFVGDDLRIVYDWDSLGVMPEPELVGHAASHFTTTWRLDVPLIPSPEEARAFVAAYEQERGHEFDGAERARLGAQAVYSLAYGARCEACFEPSATTFPPGSQRDGLARWGEEYFNL